ncbi:MAG TPA: hypothetical protein VHM19_08905 [Polyangiales bacterium]|nr:hypothetical protein [Polyangiales bacterium]
MIQLDRRVLPRSVQLSGVHVRSGVVYGHTSLRAMPVQRELWLDLDDDHPLDPETSYVIEADGLLDLDGNALDEPFHATFRTGLELGMPVPAPQADAAAALMLLAERCATRGCHSARDAALGLDLSDYAGIARTAIGARSRAPTGSIGEEGARGSFTLSALRIIDLVAGQGEPATSLLVYKILGDPHVAGEPMPPAKSLDATEIELLSAWIEAGAPER